MGKLFFLTRELSGFPLFLAIKFFVIITRDHIWYVSLCGVSCCDRQNGEEPHHPKMWRRSRVKNDRFFEDGRI